MKTVIFIATFFCISISCYADESLKALWASFYQAAKAQNFTEPAKLYATDKENQSMVFIYKKQVWIFHEGKIKQSNHAKVFNVDGINRITWEPARIGHGYFVLWSNEESILSLGF